MKVLKFGGSSVADPGRMREVAKIIKDAASTERVIVVYQRVKGSHTSCLSQPAVLPAIQVTSFEDCVRTTAGASS